MVNSIELNELILYTFQLERKLFMKTDSYSLIEQKCNNKCLTTYEIQQLNKDVRYAFVWLIKTIVDACPNLTVEDIIFCCLAKSGIDHSIIYRCMGNVNKKPVNQRKYRIKKKMEEAQCSFLFELIFSAN